MPRGIFARLLELAHEEGDALLEDAVVPPLEAPDRAAPPAKLGDAQARRSLFDVSANGRTRHAPGLTPSTPGSPRRRSIAGCRRASPRGTGTPHAARSRGVRGRCSR